jgi:hypothetical protein
MKQELTVIFVEDYKNMSKEEFSEYIKQIYQQGYDKGYSNGYLAGSCCLTRTSPYYDTEINIKNVDSSFTNK